MFSHYHIEDPPRTASQWHTIRYCAAKLHMTEQEIDELNCATPTRDAADDLICDLRRRLMGKLMRGAL